jgi:SsrA-binding protein
MLTVDIVGVFINLSTISFNPSVTISKAMFLSFVFCFPYNAFMTKIVSKNRRARYDYEIIDTVEAGIMLTGQEVKSCRGGNISLAGSYVSMVGGKPVLKSASIAPYKFASNLESYNTGRDRQLLLKKKEMQRIESSLAEKGVSLIPLEVRSGKYIKILLGLGKGQKRIDKRRKIKEKDIKRKLKKGEDY